MATRRSTRNANRGNATLRGGRTSEHGGRGGGRGISNNDNNDGENPDFSAIIAQQLQTLLPTIVTQVGNHINNSGNHGSRNDNTNDVGGNGNSNNKTGCTYKEFTACKPIEFDGKRGALEYTRWVEKMESVIDISSCATHQKVKYSACSLSGKALTWWNTQIQARGREAAVGMTWEDFKALLKEEY